MLPIESTIFVSFGILMTGKIYVSKKLNSRSLFVDGKLVPCRIYRASFDIVTCGSLAPAGPLPAPLVSTYIDTLPHMPGLLLFVTCVLNKNVSLPH